MPRFHRITPCLWFDDQAEEAAAFYTAVFPNSKVLHVSRYGDVGQEIHGMKPGTVMTVSFELDGHEFTGLNGGPVFQFNEAISLQINCEDQAEVDYYWDRLREGGDERAQQCGWLKDRFGLSWQVTPRALYDWLADENAARSQAVMAAFLKMKRIDLEQLRRVYEGIHPAPRA